MSIAIKLDPQTQCSLEKRVQKANGDVPWTFERGFTEVSEFKNILVFRCHLANDLYLEAQSDSSCVTRLYSFNLEGNPEKVEQAIQFLGEKFAVSKEGEQL